VSSVGSLRQLEALRNSNGRRRREPVGGESYDSLSAASDGLPEGLGYPDEGGPRSKRAEIRPVDSRDTLRAHVGKCALLYQGVIRYKLSFMKNQ
jgi:hypothetical protein